METERPPLLQGNDPQPPVDLIAETEIACDPGDEKLVQKMSPAPVDGDPPDAVHEYDAGNEPLTDAE